MSQSRFDASAGIKKDLNAYKAENGQKFSEVDSRIDIITLTAETTFYEECLITDTGALLVVDAGATTGQIDLASVTPVATGYTPIAGDYVRLVYGVASGNTELIDARIGTDGVAYTNAGGAIRGQINNLSRVKQDRLYDYINVGTLETGLLGTGGETYAGYHIELSVLEGEEYLVTGKSQSSNTVFPLYYIKNVSGVVIALFGAPTTIYTDVAVTIPTGGTTLVVLGSQYTATYAKKKEYKDLSAIINDITQLSNNGYVIVNMGDSLFGNFRDDTSISNKIAGLTGATVYNCGFGGGWMTSSLTANIANFSMCKLADSIASGDFTVQENALSGSDVMDYFGETVALLKSIDFSKVDIMTINYGTNDYTIGRPADSDLDKYSLYNYGTAMRYSIEKVLSAYPNIRIVLITPCWRYWNDGGGNYLEDSDTKYYNANQDTLITYADVCEGVGKEYHIPVVNSYFNLSINKFNYSQWFNIGDTTHPNEYGRRDLAKLIVNNTIRGM